MTPLARSTALPFLRTAAMCGLLLAITVALYAKAWPNAPIMDGDSPQYMEVARDLTDFRLDALHDRSPGYPLLVMLAGAAAAPTRTLLYVSLLLHGLSIWLLIGTLAAAGLTTRWLVAFCVIALLPPFVEPAGIVMTENLAQFTLVLGLASLVRWISTGRGAWLLASAMALGYSAVTRPAYQLLGIVVALSLLGVLAARRMAGLMPWRRRVVAAGTIALVTVVMVGGLSIFNERQFGFFGVVPTVGFHLTTKTILFVERAPDEFADVRDVLVRERALELVKPGGSHDGSQTVWNARAALEARTGLTTPRLSSYLLRMNLALIRRMPLEYLRDVAESVARYWLPSAGSLADFHRPTLRVLWFLLHVLVVGVFLLQVAAALGLGAVVTSARSTRAPDAGPVLTLRANAAARISYVLAGVIVFYTMAITCLVDIGEPRQRRATDLLILFMVVLGAHIWRETVGAIKTGPVVPHHA